MASSDDMFEAVADYQGQLGNEEFLPLRTGDIVRVINKELDFFIVEKDGQTGKVPQEYLCACDSQPLSQLSPTSSDLGFKTAGSNSLPQNINLQMSTPINPTQQSSNAVEADNQSINSKRSNNDIDSLNNYSELTSSRSKSQQVPLPLIQPTFLRPISMDDISESGYNTQTPLAADTQNSQKSSFYMNDKEEQSPGQETSKQPALQKLAIIKQEVKNILMQQPQDLFTLLPQQLQSLHTLYQDQSNKQQNWNQSMNDQLIEILSNVSFYVIGIVNQVEDVELAIKSGFVKEMIESMKCVPVDDIQSEIIQTIQKISFIGSAEHTYQIFQINAVQSLTNFLKNKDKNIQQYILQTFLNIILSGWQQAKQSKSIQQTTQLESFHQSSSQQELSSQFQSHLNLNQLFLIPHPYLSTLEEQGIIQTIIDQMLSNSQVDIMNKLYSLILLDILYVEGAKVPSNVQFQIITDLCDQARIVDISKKKYAFEAIAILSVNNENHDMIINSGFLDIVIEFIRDDYLREKVDSDIIISSIRIIQQLLFNSKITKNIIFERIPQLTLMKLKKNGFFENEVKILESIFADPQEMKRLILIIRAIINKSEDYIISLINAGLIRLLNEQIEKAIFSVAEDGEGKMIDIEIILHSLVKTEASSQLIFDKTDFFERYLYNLNSLPVAQANNQHLFLLYSLSENLPHEQIRRLFSKGVVQVLTNMMSTNEEDARWKVNIIIFNIISSGLEGLKEGEKHPFHQQLEQDGTIAKLIQSFKDRIKKDIHSSIAQILAILYKANQLPVEIRKDVIEEQKMNNNFDELALLAECLENHDEILAGEFEQNLFEDVTYIFQYFNITLSLLGFGSEANQKRVISAVEEKVKHLSDAEYVNDLIKRKGVQQQQVQSIIQEAQLVLEIISYIESEQLEVETERGNKNKEKEKKKKKQISEEMNGSQTERKKEKDKKKKQLNEEIKGSQTERTKEKDKKKEKEKEKDKDKRKQKKKDNEYKLEKQLIKEKDKERKKEKEKEKEKDKKNQKQKPKHKRNQHTQNINIFSLAKTYTSQSTPSILNDHDDWTPINKKQMSEDDEDEDEDDDKEENKDIENILSWNQNNPIHQQHEPNIFSKVRTYYQYSISSLFNENEDWLLLYKKDIEEVEYVEKQNSKEKSVWKQ